MRLIALYTNYTSIDCKETQGQQAQMETSALSEFHTLW